MKICQAKKRTRQDPNKIQDYGNYIGIILYNMSNSPVAEAFVDKDQKEKVKQHKWCISGSNGYPVTSINGKIVSLQRLLYPNFKMDHTNRNRLDCRSQNLRSCSHAQNDRNCGLRSNNTSGITGVHWRSFINKWEAYIKYNYKKIHLGYFKGFQDAVDARLQAERLYFEEFAPQASEKM